MLVEKHPKTDKFAIRIALAWQRCQAHRLIGDELTAECPKKIAHNMNDLAVHGSTVCQAHGSGSCGGRRTVSLQLQSRIAGADRRVWWLAASRRRRFGINANLVGEGKKRYFVWHLLDPSWLLGSKGSERPPVVDRRPLAFLKCWFDRF
jgi:hypothetical protein